MVGNKRCANVCAVKATSMAVSDPKAAKDNGECSSTVSILAIFLSVAAIIIAVAVSVSRQKEQDDN